MKKKIINFLFLIVLSLGLSSCVISEKHIDQSQDLYLRENNKIYFGKYPQTEVKDSYLINELNTLAGNKPTLKSTYNWTYYNYYILSSISNFMFYQDIDYDKDGIYDYRGVCFTQYRPFHYHCSPIKDGSYQDDNGYLTNTIYWFSYDPIEWDILKEENDKSLIISNLILDSQEYYSSYSIETFDHNGGYGYANNYELSKIRKFLNDNFYNTAFNELQKEIIEITTVDNSAKSTVSDSNIYACNDTNDKMFLLSYKEAITYYLSDSKRETQGSDYAKSQGLYVNSSDMNSYWWLRSPCNYNGDRANGVLKDGRVDNDYCHVFKTYFGVRVACQIIL